MRNDLRDASETRALERRVDGGAWGLFFLWMGIALFAETGWGAAIVGVAAITLGGQVLRRVLGLAVEGFWVVAGIAFAIGGIWSLLDVTVDIVPVICVGIGVWLLASSVAGRTRGRHGQPRSGPHAPVHPRA